MIEDEPIDLNTENTKLNNELIVLRAKYNELDEDRHYVKSLLDAEFEKRVKLEKENEQLKEENKELKSNVIDLIDKKINKLKNINEVSLIPRESVEILKELKKEVKE